MQSNTMVNAKVKAGLKKDSGNLQLILKET
jgi:hypothetical protein